MKLWYLGALTLAVITVAACEKKPEPTAHTEKPVVTDNQPPPPAPMTDPYATEQPTRSNVTGMVPPPPVRNPGPTQAQPTPRPTAKSGATTGARHAAGGQTYVVKQGDSLSKIAKKFYGDASPASMKKIQRANPQITNPDKIKAGMKLTIPA